jgi:TPR repeat protein
MQKPRRSTSKGSSIKLSKAIQEALFDRADAQEEAGNFRSAFRLFLRGAKSGHTAMMTRLALLYDYGRGVRQDKQRALEWNLRAFRKGEKEVALNIAIVLKEMGRFAEYHKWLERAVAMGDVSANIELADWWLRDDQPLRARNCARKVLKAKRHAEVSQLDLELAYWMLYGLESVGKRNTKLHPVFKNYKP